MKQKKVTKIVMTVIMIAVAILFLVPFATILSASFSSELSLKQYGYGVLPRQLSIEAYRFIFKNSFGELLNSYKTTIFVSAVGTVGGVLLMSGMAYPLSQKEFKYRRVLGFYIYFTMLFSGGMVPSYILIANYLKMKDTIWVLIVPGLMAGYNVFLLRTYFSSVPAEILESARIDGLSELGIFFKMAIPLSKHGIATISLFMLLSFWNEWFRSMLYINTDKIVSLQYMLVKILNNVNFLTQNASGLMNAEEIPEENIRMATCVLAAGPMVAAFPFFQKYFVKGVMVGSVKG